MFYTFRIDDDVTLTYPDERCAAAEFALVDSNRSFLLANLRWPERIQSEDDARADIGRRRAELAAEEGLHAHVWYRGELAGGIGLMIRARRHNAGEIGYWLGEPFTGRGIMTRAARALLDHGFGRLDLNRVVIRCAVDNTASCAIAGRLGLVHEGVERHGYLKVSGYADTHVFSALAGEWTVTHDLDAAFSCRLDHHTVLRLMRAADSDALFAIIDRERARLGVHLSWVANHTGPDVAAAWAREMRQQFVDYGALPALICCQGQVAGVINLFDISRRHGFGELGYWLSERFTGRGLVTRASAALLDHAFGPLELNRVIIRCATTNTRSCAVAGRLGFTLEGIERQRIRLADHYDDMALYSLLADEWQARRNA